MAATTGIEWTDATWNPVGGCSIHSPGCANCYAMKLAARHPEHPVYAGTVQPSNAGSVWTGKLTAAPDDHHVWTWPLRWRGAKAPVMGADKPSLIFVGDMSDVFHRERSWRDIDRVMQTAARMSDVRSHILQFLTKRPDVMRAYLSDLLKRGPVSSWAPFLWLGCSIERQQEADARREHLAAIAAMGFTTFVSYEPALGPVDWTGWEFLKQLISGGESDRDNKSARPSHPDWHRSARDFCARHGIAFFFKQWGEWTVALDRDVSDPDWRCEYGDHGQFADAGLTRWLNFEGGRGFHGARFHVMRRVGRNVAGRLLDGRLHNAFPEVLTNGASP